MTSPLDGFDSLRRHVNELVEKDLVQKELRCLRAVVWLLARHNGGGLTFPLRDLELVPEEARLDAWIENGDRTAHIRAEFNRKDGA